VATPRDAAGDGRAGAGQRAEFAELGGEIPTGCMVCGPLVPLAGFPDSGPDGVEGAEAGRGERERVRYYAQVHWLTGLLSHRRDRGEHGER